MTTLQPALRMDTLNRHQSNREIPRIDLAKIDNVAYYIEKEYLRDISDDFSYEEVPIEDFYENENEENFDIAVAKLEDGLKDKLTVNTPPRTEINIIPETTDDFIRNFLVKLNLLKTLNTFQNEWYEFVQSGKLKSDSVGNVPDIYAKNQQLNDQVKFLQFEVERFKKAAEKAKEEYVKMKKERDYHRMHHNRVAQEKNKLITDLKRLKSHYETYEPLLKNMKDKYEGAIRDKVVNQLERDRAVAELGAIKQNDGLSPKSDKKELGSTQKRLMEYRNNEKALKTDLNKQKLEEPFIKNRHPKDSEFPAETGLNPYLNRLKEDAHNLTNIRLSQTIQAHNLPISSISIHPRKMIAVTTSDDKTWKMWTIPDGQMIMRGDGHTDWVSGCDFHPNGKMLATSSGDSTVKIWNFEQQKCVHTFTDHLQAVWGVSFHSCGNFLVSGSRDNTAKIWDLNSLRCRYTLRGHADAVNTAEFLHFSNIVLTASADKTLSLWDGRTGLAAHTFYGHMNPVNHASFNLRGDTVASCDSLGIVKIWDVRKVAVIESHDFGPYAANSVTFSPLSTMIVTASDDGSLKAYNIQTQQLTPLAAHEDAVNCAKFDLNGSYILSGGCDNTLRVWS
ncbi:unnamed protein product [Brachionus calyciflorus]|uniref:Sperm-associated antigen 16 protein n=1 Tax=Brachionus calyciflorus TaxID=104777 RepID=A0A813NXT7_9BILA|nr:unnamed protein product [Brachionus calyciflorus]